MAETQHTPATRAPLPRFAPIDLVATAVTGGSVGLLMGLSVSPILAVVLTALLGAVAGASTTFRLVRRQSPAIASHTRLPAAIPIACLMSCVTIGAVVGIVARTHRWLEPTPPSDGHAVPVQQRSDSYQGVMFSDPDASVCAEWLIEAGSDATQFRAALQRSKDPFAVATERGTVDDERLKGTIRWYCSKPR